VRNLLLRSQAPLLRQLSSDRTVLAFDYDGTLAPIVARPEEAGLRERTRRLLTEAARLYPCLVISGRSRSDLQRRLRGLGLRALVGNHGLLPSGRRPPLGSWALELERRLGPLGVVIERKELSVAVHYRGAPRKRAARRAALAAARSLAGVRLLPGKQVVDVLPRGAASKGRALRRAVARLGGRRALYLGDDRTDEDVFALDWPGLVSVRVGVRRGSRARYFLRRQSDVDRLLAVLCGLRRATARVGGRSGTTRRRPRGE